MMARKTAQPIIAVVGGGAPRSMEVTVHEHKAPTDESARLLKELEEKAAAKILDSIQVADTAFTCVVQIWLEPLSDLTCFRAVFSLNGVQETAEFSMRQGGRFDVEKAIAGLRDEMAKVIAGRLLQHGFATLDPPIWRSLGR